jgi:hypothetical protein
MRPDPGGKFPSLSAKVRARVNRKLDYLGHAFFTHPEQSPGAQPAGHS